MENISSLLKEGHSANSRAISDDQLDTLVSTGDKTMTSYAISYQAADLRSQYMKKQEGQVEAAVQALCIAATKTRTAKTKVSDIIFIIRDMKTNFSHLYVSPLAMGVASHPDIQLYCLT